MNWLIPYKVVLQYYLIMFRLLFLIIDFYSLIPADVAQIFNSTAELAIPIRIPAKEEKARMTTHPVMAKAKISA